MRAHTDGRLSAIETGLESVLNTRLTDMRVYTSGQLTTVETALRAEIRAVETALRAEIRGSETQTREQLGAQIGELKILFTELKGLIERNHSETLMRFAGVERRLSALETERRPPNRPNHMQKRDKPHHAHEHNKNERPLPPGLEPNPGAATRTPARARAPRRSSPAKTTGAAHRGNGG